MDDNTDAVLLDLGLPGMDGYDVARRLREAGSQAPIPWALTDYGYEEYRRRSHAAGFGRHLLKPADSEVLEMVLAQDGWRLEPDPLPVPDGSVPSAAQKDTAGVSHRFVRLSPRESTNSRLFQ